MKKIACLSALACVLAVGEGSATAGESTVSAGYAQGDLQGVANKASGINLKYRYEWDNDQPLGVISSFTYIEKTALKAAITIKVNTTASPLVRLGASMIGPACTASSVSAMANPSRMPRTVIAVAAAAMSALPMVPVCSSTRWKTLRLTSPMNKAVSVPPTSVPGLPV
ncbi:hypothetical protein SODG_000355 [Sodalis praecaptivus]